MRPDLGWMDSALCREVGYLDLFFPEPGGSSQPAKRICRQCPVKAECLQYAMDNPMTGVYGGTSVEDRKQLARAEGRTYPYVRGSLYDDPAPTRRADWLADGGSGGEFCGSEKGYKRHREAGQKPCQACTEASSRARRERKENAA